MFREPLESWEYAVYPLLIFGVIAWKSWPLNFYWPQVLRWETFLWTLLGMVEIYHLKKTRPGLARAILISLCLSLSFSLWNPGDPRLIYWLGIAVCAYLGFLEWVSLRFSGRLRR